MDYSSLVRPRDEHWEREGCETLWQMTGEWVRNWYLLANFFHCLIEIVGELAEVLVGDTAA